MIEFSRANKLIEQVEKVITNPKKVSKGSKIKVGVDLGTMYTVIVVCDENDTPICCKLRQTNVVRDGLVLDYIEARRIVAELKKEVEDAIGVELTQACIAVPPQTSESNSKTHKYVVEGAGMEVTSVLDEPTAANNVLQIQNGAVVDIGGGTTGTSVIQDGIVIHSDDDATGGMHCTYVIAGNFRIPFEEAEIIKMDKSRELEVLTIVTPVIQKMSVIVEKHIQSYSVDAIVLCGGTACLKGIDTTMEKTINIKTYKPHNPFLVTPMGIAMGCPAYTV